MISVCIPVHIIHPSQLEYLREAIHSVLAQKGVSLEICISDDTRDARVSDMCGRLTTQDVEIRYLEANAGIGLAANINSAIAIARGDIVKILFQDDYLNNPNVLKNNARRLKFSKAKWLVTGTIHLNQSSGLFLNRMIPRVNQQFLDGKNTFSSPSVAMFYRKFFLPFDIRLSYLVDCEWYVRMLHNFGKPVLKRSIDIVNRLHENQATHDFKSLLAREIAIAKVEHPSEKGNAGDCPCITKNANRVQNGV